jgi:hypothetical protein
VLIDSWLLDLFPGRTLEELDQMDLNRLYRAKIAARMQAVEGRRKRFLEGKLKPKEISPEDWALILLMDEASKGGDSVGGG